jgi:hypothetical protein
MYSNIKYRNIQKITKHNGLEYIVFGNSKLISYTFTLYGKIKSLD